MDSVARNAWGSARPKEPPFDTACIAPWVALEFDPQGWVYSCCTSQLYPLGRIGEQRLSELWDGPRARVLKDALRRWDMSVACQPCRFHLDHGRMDPAAAIYDQYPLEDTDPVGPHMMLFALSNRCNLGCIMCSPALSSRLQSEAGLPPLESPYDDEFFEDLEPMLSGLGVAKFLGGEPFLAAEHKRIWTMLDQLESPPKLSVTTNGTVWTDTVDWLTSRFEVDISVSVDAATPETYAAVRRGGDLEVVHRNMERFAQRCRERGTNLHVSFCLMPQNAHELGRFLVWAEQYTFGAPAYVNLVSDEGVALHDLPTDALQGIRAMWSDQDASVSASLQRNAETWRTQLQQLDQVLAERCAGSAPASTRAHPVAHALLTPLDLDVVGERGLDDEVERTRAWSGDGPVAVIRCDSGGNITGVDSEHHRLGLTRENLVGLAVVESVAIMAGADGRRMYQLDQDVGSHSVARTLILSETAPTRGAEGAVIRVLQLSGESGPVYIVAEDRLYDVARREATPVRVALRQPGERDRVRTRLATGTAT